MKLYGFTNFVEQYLVPYEYTGISLVVVDTSGYVVIIVGYLIVLWGLTSYTNNYLAGSYYPVLPDIRYITL